MKRPIFPNSSPTAPRAVRAAARRIRRVCIVVLCLVAVSGPARGQTPEGESSGTFSNPLLDGGGDPWATFHDGLYYYMHTLGNRIDLWVTDDITDLRHARRKTIWTPAEPEKFRHIWAPEIHRIGGKWYVYFTADDGNTDNHRMYVLENPGSDPMEGTFSVKGRIVTDPADNWAIDGSVFEHRGALYMVWSGWKTQRVSTETQCIYIARMENPWTQASERVLISEPEYDWERRCVNDDGTRLGHIVYVNEGPQPLASPSGGHIHIAYSASGVWTAYYCLGLLTARADADLLDPRSWSKSPQPILQQSPADSVFCTGHNSFFPSPDGTETYILYHARSVPATRGPGSGRSPRAQKIAWADDYPVVGRPQPLSAVLPKPSGTPLRK